MILAESTLDPAAQRQARGCVKIQVSARPAAGFERPLPAGCRSFAGTHEAPPRSGTVARLAPISR